MMFNHGHAVVLRGCCLLALFMAGCQTPSAPSRSGVEWTPSKEDQSAAEVEAIEPVWDISEPAGLVELTEQALSASPVLRQSWASARQQAALLEQIRSPYYPKLNLNATGKMGRSDNNVLGEDANMTIYGPGATLTWLLLDAGGRGASFDAAVQKLLASNYSYNQAFQTLLRDVQGAYYSLYSAQASVKASEDNVASTAKTLEAAQKKRDAGLAVELDVLSAQSNYEQALYNLENDRAQVEISRGQLAQAVGLPSQSVLQIKPPSAPLPSEADWPEDRLKSILEESLARRSDLASARATVLAAQYSVSAESSGLWPTLSAGASADKTWTRYSTEGLNDTDSQTLLGYLSLSWDVFDGFLTLNKKRAAEAALEVAREQLRTAELSAGQDVWSKYYTLLAALKKIGFAKAALASAEQAYTLASDSYNSGLKDITYLLDAQGRLSTARSTAVAAENSVYVSYVNMIHAMGLLHGDPQQQAGAKESAEVQ